MKREGKEKLYTSFIGKLRDNKRLELCVYAAVVAAALIAFALSGGFAHCAAKTVNSSEESVNMHRTEDEIESRLESILSGIDGAGMVRVMLQYENGDEAVPALSQSGSGLSLWGGSAQTEDASRLPSICGAIIVAEGADDIRVRNELQSAVKTLLGLNVGRIGVYVMQRGQGGDSTD